MKKLVFDIVITGHHSEYISHLVDYLEHSSENGVDYYFVVHPSLDSRFPKIYEKAKKICNIFWQPITKNELKKVASSKKILNSFVQFEIMKKYADQNKVDHVIALDFHTIKYGCLIYKTKFTISSILFLQFFRLKRNSFLKRIEFYKRYYITKWCISNSQVKNIYVLNDIDSANFMNKVFKTKCFRVLQDPIPNILPDLNFNIYRYYKIANTKKIFLHIGSLGSRKGTLEVINSCLYLEETIQNHIVILLVGKANIKSEEEEYLKQIRRVNSNTNSQIIWDNDFVGNSKMKSIFNQCEAVLIPYKNTEFSSGILGHAAASNKIVIATKGGLIEKLVNQFNLGVLLNQPNAESIGKAIKYVLDNDFQESFAEKFVNEHNPNSFSEAIFKLN